MEHDIRLEDIGWKVLQKRQVHLEKHLRKAIRTAHDADGAVHLVDLAVGSGRHLMEILRTLPELQITGLLRDESEAKLHDGRQLAQQLGLTRLRFGVGDAFDEHELGHLEPRPNVVLAAGIYELTPDNHRVSASLRGLVEGMAPGGQLVYTDQPRHPHLEMIGRVAVQREESPWAMRRREIEEMNQLIADAGFELVEQDTDDQGLFTVGRARRP